MLINKIYRIINFYDNIFLLCYRLYDREAEEKQSLIEALFRGAKPRYANLIC